MSLVNVASCSRFTAPTIIDSPGGAWLERCRRARAQNGGRRSALCHARPVRGTLRTHRAHYETTAVEIIDDCPEIDVFVAGLGTGGTLTGAGRRLREYRVEREGLRRRTHARRDRSRDSVRWMRALCPKSLMRPMLDGRFLVTTAESIGALRRLTQLEGIFAGVSSGGVLAVAGSRRRNDGVGDDRRAAG